MLTCNRCAFFFHDPTCRVLDRSVDPDSKPACDSKFFQLNPPGAQDEPRMEEAPTPEDEKKTSLSLCIRCLHLRMVGDHCPINGNKYPVWTCHDYVALTWGMFPRLPR